MAGFALTWGAFIPDEVTKTSALPAERGGEVVLARFSLWHNGLISGSFSSNGAPSEDRYYVFWLIDDGEHTILSWAGNNITFSDRKIPTSGEYYISCGFSYDLPNQSISVEIQYDISGVNLRFIAPGVFILATGIVVVFFSSRIVRQEA